MKWKIKYYSMLIALMVMVWVVIPLVYAEENVKKTYKPTEKIDLGLHLTNGTGDVTGANCSTQIRNATFGVVNEHIMNEIGGGYYNYTYNTSKTGQYFCRQNCTQGTFYDSETCDFIVEGDDKVSIAVIFVMAIVISVLFLLSRFVRIEALKYLLISIAAIMTVLTLAIGLFLAKDSLPVSVQSLMNTAYIVVLYTMDFILAIGFLFVMFYYVSKWLPEKFRMRK